LKRFDESVPRQLGEILINHGRPPLTDAKLCENLLKDYCPEFKEEISLLVLGVRERVASDLLVSQDGLERGMLRALLVNRLRKAHSLSEGDARWIVESWATATRALARKGSVPSDPAPILDSNPSNPWPKPGVISQYSKPVRAVAVSGSTMVSGGDDCVIRLWPSGTILKEFDTPVSALAFSPNGVLLAAATGSQIYVIDLQSDDAMSLGQAGKQPSLAFSAGGKSLAASSTDSPCEIRVWNLQTGQMRILKGDWKGPSSISFSPDGNRIAAADSDRTIRLWDLEVGTARVIGRSNRQITSVAFLPDGKRLVSGSWDETMRVWSIQTGEARTLAKNCSCISHVAISADGERVVASSLDGRIRVWTIQTGRSRTIGECYGVNAIAFTTRIVTGSDDGAVRLWDVPR
jgi:WD40 repeat protein